MNVVWGGSSINAARHQESRAIAGALPEAQDEQLADEADLAAVGARRRGFGQPSTAGSTAGRGPSRRGLHDAVLVVIVTRASVVKPCTCRGIYLPATEFNLGQRFPGADPLKE